MGFFKNLLSNFGKQDIHISLTPKEGGISVYLSEGDEPLSAEDVRDFLEALPDEASNLLQQATRIADAFIVSYPQAKRLLNILKQLDDAEIGENSFEQLNEMQPPSDFGVEWQIQTAPLALQRVLHGAVRYLGDGWFQSGKDIWPITTDADDPIIPWLSKVSIKGHEIHDFVATGLSVAIEKGLPLTCDVTIIERLPKLKLELRNTKPELLHIKLNIDAAISQPVFIADDSQHMWSDNKILAGWAPLFTEQLLLAMDEAGLQLEGDDIPAFLKHDLLPRANHIQFDSQLLTSKYPIYDSNGLSVAWHIQREQTDGIGQYVAMSFLHSERVDVALRQALAWIDEDQQFQQVVNGWIEITDAFKNLLNNTLKQHVPLFVLEPTELLNTSERLKQRNLAAPQPQLHPAGKTNADKANSLLSNARQHGLPVIVQGLRRSISSVIATACAELLAENRHSKILWVASHKKLDQIQHQINQMDIPKTHKRRIQLCAHADVATRITAAQDLLIIEDIDLIPGTLADSLSQIQRRWTVATTTKQNWTSSKRRTRRILRAINMEGISTDQLTTYLLFEYDNQESGLLKRIVSPFKRIITAVTDNEEGGVPIPPRTSGQVAHPVPRKTQAIQKEGLSRESTFIAEAKRLAKYKEVAANHVPFMQYYPTYAAMNREQRRWYFYWRDQVRRSDMLATDTSYLFVYIYECINLIGFDTPQAAYDHLSIFWEHYRKLNPKLDQYLIDWLADFLIVHHLPQPSPLEWYAEALRAGGVVHPRLAIEAWVTHNGDFNALPAEMIYQLASYYPSRNKFYREHENPLLVEAAYRQGLSVIDNDLRGKMGKGLFEYYIAPDTFPVVRSPFTNAIHQYGRDTITIAQVRDWDKDDTLAAKLTAIIKHSENILRQQAGVSSRLRGYEISEAWATLLEDTLTGRESVTAAPVPKITIDFNKLAEVKQETDALRERLIADEESLEAVPDAASIPAPIETVEPPDETPPVALRFERPVDTPDDLLTEVSEIADVLRVDRPEVLELLRVLQTNKWRIPARDLEATIKTGFVNVIIDDVNLRALDAIGDNLIFDENGIWVVAEDYVDELDFILNHPGYQPEPTAATPANDAYDLLETDWADFARQLKPHHWEAVAALLAGIETGDRLEAIARRVFSTANLLIDELNLFALDYIADNVVEYDENNAPIIIEEYQESLAGLLQWATENAIMEA